MQSIYFFVVSPHPVDRPIPSFNFGKKIGLSKEVVDNLELGERSGQISRVLRIAKPEIYTWMSQEVSKWLVNGL